MPYSSGELSKVVSLPRPHVPTVFHCPLTSYITDLCRRALECVWNSGGEEAHSRIMGWAIVSGTIAAHGSHVRRLALGYWKVRVEERAALVAAGR